MSELKMSDYFYSGSIDYDNEGCLIENGFKIAKGICKYKASAVSHAVSSHDRLLEEVERLRSERDSAAYMLQEIVSDLDCYGELLENKPQRIKALLAKIKGENK